jgi:hypothetical protein
VALDCGGRDTAFRSAIAPNQQRDWPEMYTERKAVSRPPQSKKLTRARSAVSGGRRSSRIGRGNPAVTVRDKLPRQHDWPGDTPGRHYR